MVSRNNRQTLTHWCKFDLAGLRTVAKRASTIGTEELWAAIVGRVVTRPQNGLLKALFGEGDKSTLRAGFGVVYDRIGAGLVSTFDANDRSGCSTSLTNPAGVITAADAPRLTDIHKIPTTDNSGNTIFFPAPPGAFPQTFPDTLDTGDLRSPGAWTTRSRRHTPIRWIYRLDGNCLTASSIEASYVGRLAHRGLIQEDLAMPLDLVDKKSGSTISRRHRL